MLPEIDLFDNNPGATVASSRRGFFVGQKCTFFEYNPGATVASSRRGFFVIKKCTSPEKNVEHMKDMLHFVNAELDSESDK